MLAGAGIMVVRAGARVPRMNGHERWVLSCCRELPDCTLIWGQRCPLRPLPPPITDPDQVAHLGIRRRQRLGGILSEHDHAA